MATPIHSQSPGSLEPNGDRNNPSNRNPNPRQHHSASIPCKISSPLQIYLVVKVADFGVARFQNQGGLMTAETGTYRWMAPEVINHQPYDQKADIFSFAIVLWELVTAKVPYESMTPLQAALGVRQGLRPDLPTNGHPKLLELMQKCWDATPSNRPSFSDVRTELENLLEVQENSEAINCT